MEPKQENDGRQLQSVVVQGWLRKHAAIFITNLKLVVIMIIGCVIGNTITIEYYPFGYTGGEYSDVGGYHDDGFSSSLGGTQFSPDCNIDVVTIYGDILPGPASSDMYDQTISSYVSRQIKQDQDDEQIKGILVDINSGGGDPAAGEDMMNALKRSTLPIAAVIGSIGASAAYLAATGADTIIASPYADVGSIGLTMSYVDNSVQNEKEGLHYVSLSSGKYKDTGDPNKPLTEAEYKLLERDLDIYHKQFVKEVAVNRKLSVDTVAALADGSTLPGALALQNKLIDSLGDRENARGWFAQKLGLPMEEVVFCDE